MVDNPTSSIHSPSKSGTQSMDSFFAPLPIAPTFSSHSPKPPRSPPHALTGEKPRPPTFSRLTFPKLKKEEIKVEVEDKNRRNPTMLGIELRGAAANLSRWFRLSKNAKFQDMMVSMENEVLVVIVPKEEEKRKADVRSIHIYG